MLKDIMKKLLFITILTSIFTLSWGQCASQCPIFTPGMTITQVNPGSPPFGEDVTKVIDGNSNTKYLNFNRTNTGFIVNTGKNTTAVRMDLTTANDEPSRDPIDYQIQGSNNGTTWTTITSGSISCNSTRFLTRSFNFTNNTSYSWYRITFASLCNLSLANSMQVAEVQLYSNSVTPSVTISRSSNNVCQGTNITFTTTPTNGGTPTYQWRRNGSNVVGATGSSWISNNINNNDVITCVMTSNAPCITTSNVTSNSLTMGVTSKVTPSVSILGNPSVVRKNTVTLQALPVNGGGAPTYKWYKNNVLKSTSNPWTDSANVAGTDTIRVVMRTSQSCITIDSAIANYNITVLSLTDVDVFQTLDKIHFSFVKNADDVVSIYEFNEKTGKSRLMTTTTDLNVVLEHTSKYYLVVSDGYSRYFGPFSIVAEEPRRTLSIKQLLGQFVD